MCGKISNNLENLTNPKPSPEAIYAMVSL